MLGSTLFVLALVSGHFTEVGGIKVRCLENIRGKVGRARVEIVVGSGALQEADDERGVAHLLEHLLLRPLGFDDSNGATAWDYTSYYQDVRAEALKEASLELLQAVRTADFDQAAFELERKIVLRELEDRGLEESIFRPDPLFGQTVLARSPGGSDSSVRRLSEHAARIFHQTHYTKGNLAVILSGAVDCDDLTEAITDELSLFPAGTPTPPTVLSEKEDGPRSITGSPGGPFVRGYFWYGAKPREEVALQVLAKHLEQRALTDLRQALGITYSPQAEFLRMGPGGLFQLTISIPPNEEDTVSDWFDRSVKKLRKAKNMKQETTRAQTEIRERLEFDGVRAGLAAIRGEPQPIDIISHISSKGLSAAVDNFLTKNHQFGTYTGGGNAGTTLVLVLFGLMVLIVVGFAGWKIIHHTS